MSPMIDLVFLLLIFFMVASKFKTLDHKLEAKLPRNIGVHSATSPEVTPRRVALKIKGEIVVIIDRAQSSPVNESDIEAQLRTVLQSMSVRDAAEFVAQAHGVAKRKIYQMALDIERKP